MSATTRLHHPNPRRTLIPRRLHMFTAAGDTVTMQDGRVYVWMPDGSLRFMIGPAKGSPRHD